MVMRKYPLTFYTKDGGYYNFTDTRKTTMSRVIEVRDALFRITLSAVGIIEANTSLNRDDYIAKVRPRSDWEGRTITAHEYDSIFDRLFSNAYKSGLNIACCSRLVQRYVEVLTAPEPSLLCIVDQYYGDNIKKPIPKGWITISSSIEKMAQSKHFQIPISLWAPSNKYARRPINEVLKGNTKYAQFIINKNDMVVLVIPYIGSYLTDFTLKDLKTFGMSRWVVLLDCIVGEYVEVQIVRERDLSVCVAHLPMYTLPAKYAHLCTMKGHGNEHFTLSSMWLYNHMGLLNDEDVTYTKVSPKNMAKIFSDKRSYMEDGFTVLEPLSGYSPYGYRPSQTVKSIKRSIVEHGVVNSKWYDVIDGYDKMRRTDEIHNLKMSDGKPFEYYPVIAVNLDSDD